MATTKTFNKYDIRIYGGNSGRVALVTCYQGNSFAGRIDFHAEGEALVSDYLWHPSTPSNTSIVLQMPVRRFADVVETLRRESPLKLYIDVDAGSGAATNGSGYLGTGAKEPIAELVG